MDEGIGQWTVRHALRRPDAVALVDAGSGEQWSYARLDAETSSVAAGLQELGLQRGDRLALLMDNDPHVLLLMFAAAKLGAVTVPVNFRLAAGEVRYVLADCGARVLAVSGRHAALAAAALGPGAVDASSAADVSGAVDASDARGSDAADGAAVRHVVDVDGGATAAFAGARVVGWSTLAGHEPMTHLPLVRSEDVCVLMYTSGTTGNPKGAMLTHGNMLWNAINVAVAGPGLSANDRTVAVAPLFHIGALGLSALPLLYVGGTVIVQNGFDPAGMLAHLIEHRVTTQFMVPAMWAAMTQVPGIADAALPDFRYALCGGAPCPLAVIEFFTGAGWTFMEGFGMTELSPAATFLDAADVVSHAGSVGRPFLHVDARLVDEQNRTVPVGVVGELVLTGPTVFAGYWGRPDATAEAIVDGWFHSGDLGVADADGFITLVDRKKDMIISGGENVYPIEVERVLQRHPGIADCAVIGVADPRWGETVVAVVVAREGADLDPDQVIAFCRGEIARYKCPTRVEVVAELPRNATGKLLKRTLRERFTGSAAAVSR